MKKIVFIFIIISVISFSSCDKKELQQDEKSRIASNEIFLLTYKPWKYEKVTEYINGQYNRTYYPSRLSKFIFTRQGKFYYYDNFGILKSYGTYQYVHGNPDYLIYTSENLGTVYTYYLVELTPSRYTIYNEWVNASGDLVRWVYYLYRPKEVYLNK